MAVLLLPQLQFMRLGQGRVCLTVCLLHHVPFCFLACLFTFVSFYVYRVSPEELFVDLAVNNVDTTAADRLAIITGLDVNTLYEVMYNFCFFYVN